MLPATFPFILLPCAYVFVDPSKNDKKPVICSFATVLSNYIRVSFHSRANGPTLIMSHHFSSSPRNASLTNQRRCFRQDLQRQFQSLTSSRRPTPLRKSMSYAANGRKSVARSPDGLLNRRIRKTQHSTRLRCIIQRQCQSVAHFLSPLSASVNATFICSYSAIVSAVAGA